MKNIDRKAFWSLTGGLAMVVDFLLLPIAYLLGSTFQSLLLVGAFFTLFLAPFAARRLIEKLAKEGSTYCRYELNTLVRFGRAAMLYWNIPAWGVWALILFYRWVLVPVGNFILFLAVVLLPNKNDAK